MYVLNHYKKTNCSHWDVKTLQEVDTLIGNQSP